MKTSNCNKAQRFGPILVQALLCLCLLFLISGNAAAEDEYFDHFLTGFPLSGSHIRVNCDSCHIKGIFKGTPKNCFSCHDGGRSGEGKSTRHVASSETCDDCHTTFNWSAVAIDHSAVQGSCKTCHTLPARGHISTNGECDDCHGTVSWDGARFDHGSGTADCFRCHNGSDATGKPRDHIQSSNQCADCHNTNSWDVQFDHGNVTAPCESCHSKPRNHPPTTGPCSNCHPTTSWDRDQINMDHSGVTATCESCHQRPPSPHPPEGACNTCHNTTSWGSVIFDHSTTTAPCSSCHDKPPGHIESSDVCDDCHNTNVWDSATVNHSAITGNCVSCHNGQDATGPSNKHIDVKPNACEYCHDYGSQWVVLKPDHDYVNGSCSSCHDLPGSPHMPAPNPCEDCHITQSWTIVSFDHGDTNLPCSICHDKPQQGHFETGLPCDTCHQEPPARFQNVDYGDHGGLYPGDHKSSVTCIKCHKDNDASINWGGNESECARCHENDYNGSLPKKHKWYPGVNYPIDKLSDCTDSCHEYEDITEAVRTKTRNAGEHHVGDGGWN